MEGMLSKALWRPVAVVALPAAGLGYGLFGLLGVALRVPLAVSAALVLHVMSRVVPGLGVAVPLLIAGAAIYDASTLAWGGADAPDGTRYKVSPIGLSHVLSPHQTVSPAVDCRWHFAGGDGDSDLCAMAPGAEIAYRQLLAVFPLLGLGITGCLVGSLAQCRHAWRRAFPHSAAAWSAAVVSMLALWLFSSSLGPALSALATLDVGIGGTLGTMEMTAAILLCLVAGSIGPAPGSLSQMQQRAAK